MEKTKEETAAELLDVHQKFVHALWAVWRVSRGLSKELGQGQFSRLSVVTLTQVAAVVAVDCGLTEEQFTDVCRANFAEAYQQAPKFG